MDLQQRLRGVRGVLFDMDGLLLDSERLAYQIGREASAHLGLPWRHEVAMSMIGLNSRDGYRLVREFLDRAHRIAGDRTLLVGDLPSRHACGRHDESVPYLLPGSVRVTRHA